MQKLVQDYIESKNLCFIIKYVHGYVKQVTGKGYEN